MLKNCFFIQVSILIVIMFIQYIPLFSQDSNFMGLNVNLGNLSILSDAKSRSISPENFSGEKGKGGMATLDQGSAADAARDLGQVGKSIHM
jgi:hypothetical protein